MQIQTGDISHTIQLAIAPVFLLSGVGTNLIVLTNRLARIIDRTRSLEESLDAAFNAHYLDELDTLYRRRHLMNLAITTSTACGLLICLVIAMLFIGNTLTVKLDNYIAASFVVAMLALIGNFGFFLNEIYIASTSQRARRHVRQPD